MSAFPNGLTQYYANGRQRRRECEVADKLSESQETSITQIVNIRGFYEVNAISECIYATCRVEEFACMTFKPFTFLHNKHYS